MQNEAKTLCGVCAALRRFRRFRFRHGVNTMAHKNRTALLQNSAPDAEFERNDPDSRELSGSNWKAKKESGGVTKAGIRLRKVPGKTEKVTCENCGRRRFGGVYEMDTSSGAVAPPSPQGEGNKRRNQNG